MSGNFNISVILSQTQITTCHSFMQEFQIWNELKQILTDKWIQLETLIKFLTTCNITPYTSLASIQGWTEKSWSHLAWFSQEDGARGIWKRESTRTSTNNRMSSSNTSTHSPDETTLDWSDKRSNERLRNITRPIRDFLYTQQLKYMGHICLLDNSELQKQVPFDHRMPKTIWNKLEWIFSMNILQIGRTMIKRNELMQVLDHMFRHKHRKTHESFQCEVWLW